VITHNADGFGGLAVCEEYPGQKARCVWIASNGRPQFTTEIGNRFYRGVIEDQQFGRVFGSFVSPAPLQALHLV
jgi:hypothetical protein